MLTRLSRQLISLVIVSFIAGCFGFDGTPYQPPPPPTDVTVDATVPELIYSNVKEIVMDARRTATMNGKRELFYHWVCAQYPGTVLPKIDSATSSYTRVSGFEIGNYVFRLRVSDKDGHEAFDDYALEVRKDTLTGPPIIIPLPDRTINLPQSQILIISTNSVVGNYYNRIFLFDWTVIKQPIGSNDVNIRDNKNPSLFIEGLELGTYSFRLEVTNELGLKASDTVDVIVKEDTLAGTTQVFENLPWLKVNDPYGDSYYTLMLYQPSALLYRTRDMIEIRVWDSVKKEWIASDKIFWQLENFEVRITAYDPSLELENTRTKVEVKFK